MRRFALMMALLAGPLAAEGWNPMTDDQNHAALEGRKLQHATARQDFSDSGRTLYNAGADSCDFWRPEGNQNCSL